jgi:iron(III)-salmochelin esterase
LIKKSALKDTDSCGSLSRSVTLAVGIASLAVLLIVAGCSSQERQSAQGPIPKPAASQETPESAPIADAQPETKSTSPQEKEVSTQESTRVASPVAPTEPVVEKIPGYKVPAEYLSLPSKHFSQNITAISLPPDYEKRPDKTYPLVIVFGGATECAMSPKQGALAWMHYYKTDEAVIALASKHLDADHFRGLATPANIRDFNNRLRSKPYKGVILACPASPLLSPQMGPEFPEYEAYIIDDLIPALKKRYRIAPKAIGVDGVSMGGSRSMYYGFKYPEIFSSVGSIQGAFGPYIEVYKDLVTWNAGTLRKRQIQLVTSDKDMMAASVLRLHQMLVANRIPHAYLVLTGPHGYIFNQGPGALSLLMFHDHALR